MRAGTARLVAGGLAVAIALSSACSGSGGDPPDGAADRDPPAGPAGSTSASAGASAGPADATSTTPGSTASAADGPGTAAGPGGSATPGLFGDAVVVGGLATLSSPATADLAGADLGARARFDRANREGGVHGRRVELVEVVDDAGDPARALAGVRRLVEEDDVLAVVPVVSHVLTPEVRQALDVAGVPYLGWGPGFCGSERAFGITGCWPAADALDGHGMGEAVATGAFVDAVAAALPAGSAATVAVVGDAGAEGQQAVDRVRDLAGAAGLEVVLAEATVPAPQPVADYRPWAQRILVAAGGSPPALVVHTGSIANVLGLSYQLRELGYAGVQANPRTYDPVFALNHSLRYRIIDMLVGTPFTPVEDRSVPAVVQASADLVAAGVAADTTGQPAVLAGYWAADLFVALLEAAGPDPTPERLVAAARGWTYDGGGVGPSTWPAAHTAPVPCTSLLRVRPVPLDNGLVSGRFDLVASRSCTAAA
jgi:ABC-type branched-subunit amino acid transport system substrate-binding protein